MCHVILFLRFYTIRIASADFMGFLRIWRIEDLLTETEQHLLKAHRKGKTRIETYEFVLHRSTYSHRHHITMANVPD